MAPIYFPLFFASSRLLEPVRGQPQVTINPTVVKKLLQLHWSKDSAADGAKINPDAAVLVTEYLRLFVIGEEPKRTTEVKRIIGTRPFSDPSRYEKKGRVAPEMGLQHVPLQFAFFLESDAAIRAVGLLPADLAGEESFRRALADEASQKSCGVFSGHLQRPRMMYQQKNIRR